MTRITKVLITDKEGIQPPEGVRSGNAQNVTLSQESKTALASKASAANDSKKQRRMPLASFFLLFTTILFSSDSGQSDPAIGQALRQWVSTLKKNEQSVGGGIHRELRINFQRAVLSEEPRYYLQGEIFELREANAVNEELQSEVARFVRSYPR